MAQWVTAGQLQLAFGVLLEGSLSKEIFLPVSMDMKYGHLCFYGTADEQ